MSYIVPQPVEGHKQLLALLEVVVRKSQIDDIGAAVSEKPIFLHQDVHFLYFKDVVIFVVCIHRTVPVFKEVVVLYLADSSGKRSKLEGNRCVLLEMVVTNL